LTLQLPKHFKLAYAKAQIEQRTAELAAEISAWADTAAAEAEGQIVALCVVRGGVYFFAGLLRALSVSVEPNFCRAWCYSSDENIQHETAVRVSMENVVATNRTILLVDDICDTSATLQKLENILYDLGAREVKSVVLIQREQDGSAYTPSWVGFRHKGDEWFVGYGMEDKNCYSNLPDVYALERSN